MFLSFNSPLEFLLRYTVITGIVIAAVGTAICMLAGSIVKARRHTDILDKSDTLYRTLITFGLIFIIIGMIMMVLPIEDTFYRG